MFFLCRMLENPTNQCTPIFRGVYSLIIPPRRGEESKALRAREDNHRRVKNKSREGNCKGKGRRKGRRKGRGKGRRKGRGKGRRKGRGKGRRKGRRKERRKGRRKGRRKKRRKGSRREG